VPVTFLTAYADNEILRRASAVAPYGYLVKPVQQRELNATVQMALARVRASRERLQAERRLRLALDNARMGVVTLTEGADLVEIDGHFPPIADKALRGLRMGVEQFLQHLTHDSQNKVHKLLEDGEDLHLLTRWRRMNGEERLGWMEVHAGYVVSEQAVVGVCRDVTREVEREEALRQAAVVFESAADAILILDPEGRVTTANPAFTRLTGWPNSDIRGRHPNEFLHARRGSDRELLNGTPIDFLGHAEVVCLRHDGTSFPAWEHVAPVRDDSGNVTHRVLTFTDISALRMAESRVRHLAYHDPLTGLGNRNQLREVLANLPAAEPDDEAEWVLMFIDLDGFKVINDSLGHEIGDSLLVVVADRIRGGCGRGTRRSGWAGMSSCSWCIARTTAISKAWPSACCRSCRFPWTWCRARRSRFLPASGWLSLCETGTRPTPCCAVLISPCMPPRPRGAIALSAITPGWPKWPMNGWRLSRVCCRPCSTVN
jgi:PAS domain S-box-containing protein